MQMNSAVLIYPLDSISYIGIKLYVSHSKNTYVLYKNNMWCSYITIIRRKKSFNWEQNNRKQLIIHRMAKYGRYFFPTSAAHGNNFPTLFIGHYIEIFFVLWRYTYKQG